MPRARRHSVTPSSWPTGRSPGSGPTSNLRSVAPDRSHAGCRSSSTGGDGRRAPGGSVLIDASGSMGLDVGDIWEIVELVAGATVAAYAGDGREGTLRILARGGRGVCQGDCAADLGSGNIIDGPALRWLARQP